MQSLEQLERLIGHRFSDARLLELALTHRSASAQNNERLEFLGDAALGFVVAQWLWRSFPDANEHSLTLMRASLVKRPTLVAVARAIRLGEYLRLGPGERRSGGHHRESILADALEALLGAVVEDGGYDAVRRVVQTLFATQLAAVDAKITRDSKTQLQECVQARGLRRPEYRVTTRSGDEHAPRFSVECRVAELGIVTQGEGGSRRDAEQIAAHAALVQIEASQ